MLTGLVGLKYVLDSLTSVHARIRAPCSLAEGGMFRGKLDGKSEVERR